MASEFVNQSMIKIEKTITSKNLLHLFTIHLLDRCTIATFVEKDLSEEGGGPPGPYRELDSFRRLVAIVVVFNCRKTVPRKNKIRGRP